MASSVFSSELYTRLFPAGDASRLFTDSAEVRAMQLVEGTLAKVQGDMGLIPLESALYIHRASLEIPLDPGGLAQSVAENGIPVPGLVAAFRKAMEAPEHAQYVHWGATTQDIVDTGLILRLRQYLGIMETRLRETAQALGKLSEIHADLPMPGRTWGQHATPTTFGATTAHWGAPLLQLLTDLPSLRDQMLWVSLSGAAGTAAALGPHAPELRARLAKALNLHDPQRSWHTDRSPILTLAGWLARLCVALGKMAEDLLLLTQTDIAEVTLSATGASSTMPQKQNPVGPSAIVALTRQAIGLNTLLQGAGLHRQDRDAAAWYTEWLTLPQLCLSAASALEHARALSTTLAPNPAAMQTALSTHLDLIHAEALSFRLAQTLPRPEAQTATKDLCKRAVAENTPLADLVRAAWPDLPLTDIFDPDQQTGQAPAEARAFAAKARAL
ncbi:adenylosuccinate lyase family protein [Thalassovita sp.]|uniref:class-II fumarase/aspartase family protein n=1 Tax=Thalassovita sp. TaxID=1979401 RepID=UPI0029DE526B|nr:adenylosuccinate lyase family protein [Thalassovita sp.]